MIYESRGLKRLNKPGRPVLCDFGEARFGKKTYIDDIEPYVYRAPEIILDIPWTYSADIWNLGVMVSVSNANVGCFIAQQSRSVLNINRSGTFLKISTCSMLRMVAAEVQACTTWLRWLLCWDCLRWIIFGVLKHRGITLTKLATGKVRLKYHRSPWRIPRNS